MAQTGVERKDRGHAWRRRAAPWRRPHRPGTRAPGTAPGPRDASLGGPGTRVAAVPGVGRIDASQRVRRRGHGAGSSRARGCSQSRGRTPPRRPRRRPRREGSRCPASCSRPSTAGRRAPGDAAAGLRRPGPRSRTTGEARPALARSRARCAYCRRGPALDPRPGPSTDAHAPRALVLQGRRRARRPSPPRGTRAPRHGPRDLLLQPSQLGRSDRRAGRAPGPARVRHAGADGGRHDAGRPEPA